MAARSEFDVNDFFKKRAKNPDSFFFNPDGTELVGRDKSGTETKLPMVIATRQTPDELGAAYEERKEQLSALQDTHDKNIRALLDAIERGEPDDVVLGLNRTCEASDSALFEANWKEKNINVLRGVEIEIRKIDLTNPREVRKFPSDVYGFVGRRVGLDFEYRYEEAVPTVSASASDTRTPLAKIILQSPEAAMGAPTTSARGELETVGPIEFSNKSERYKEFDNFFPAPITLDGKVYPTVEHYFQAMKFPGFDDYQEMIRRSKDASTAKKLGGIADPSRPIRPDWESVRDDIMRRAIDAKFRQNPELGVLLSGTGNRTLTEVSTDIYWGVGKAKTGKNRLGQLLAELRSVLQSESGGAAASAAASASSDGKASSGIPVITAVPAGSAVQSGKIRLKSTKPVVPSATAPVTSVSNSEARRAIIERALGRLGSTVPTVPTVPATVPAVPVPEEMKLEE